MPNVLKLHFDSDLRMSYRNVYPTSHEELAESLPELNEQLLEAFPGLIRKAIDFRPRAAIQTLRPGDTSGNVAELNDPDFIERWMAEPHSLHNYLNTQVIFPLDSGMLHAEHSRSGQDLLSVKTYRPPEAIATGSLFKGIPIKAKLQRVLSLSSFAIDEEDTGYFCYMATPATCRQVEDNRTHFYYFSSNNIGPGLPHEDSGQPPDITREALPSNGQRIFDEYGPFGVAKYEIEQDIALLNNVARNYN